MIHDYYLSEARDYKDIELAKKKKEVLNKLKESKIIDEFYPNQEDLQNLPENSTLIKISFTLKKPYTSKDEGEFHIINGNKLENPIVRDKFTGLPMVRPSTWKGHLRFAAERVKSEKDQKKTIIKRLFGSETEEEETLKGRLYFFPTLFEEKAKRDVITPLKRDTRTPTKRGPIPLEVMKPESVGEFYLLYVPSPKGFYFREEQIKENLGFISEALRLMFYTYGFSAKKTAGFGVIKETLTEGEIWMKLGEGLQEKNFSKLDELKNKLAELCNKSNE